MRRRQTVPSRWLIVTDAASDGTIAAVRRLPRETGIILVEPLTRADRHRLRQFARRRQLTLVEERLGDAARVHDSRELRAAMLRRTPLILLSPVHPTRSHPDWAPLPRMRAAALARLGGRQVVALGGMDERRYAKIARLGFIGWAGISAFRT